MGYTLILVIDKVMFDSHALFADEHGHGNEHGHDPAQAKFEENVKRSFAKQSRASMSGDRDEAKKSMAETQKEIEDNMKSYLNPHDRFAARMKASLSKKDADTPTDDATNEQKALFVDSNNIDLQNNVNATE